MTRRKGRGCFRGGQLCAPGIAVFLALLVVVIVEKVAASPQIPCSCYKVEGTFRNEHRMWDYYPFLLGFAAPMLRAISTAKGNFGSGRKILLLPASPQETMKVVRTNTPGYDGAFPSDRYRLTYSWDSARTMQPHADFLFAPILSEVVEWRDHSGFDEIPCAKVEWEPEEVDPASVRFLRAYGHSIAGVEEEHELPADIVIARAIAGLSTRPRLPQTQLVLLLRRGRSSNSTCTGVCKHHLDRGFFLDAERFLKGLEIPY